MDCVEIIHLSFQHERGAVRRGSVVKMSIGRRVDDGTRINELIRLHDASSVDIRST